MLKVIDKDIKELSSRFGSTFKYYPTTLCTCLKRNDGSFDPNHDCIQGFRYEITPYDIYALRTDVKQKVIYTPYGAIYNGDAQLTIPKFYNGTEQQVYTTVDRGDVFVDKRKTKHEFDILQKGVRDTLNAFDVVDILRISSNGTVYEKDTDFTVTKIDSSPIELTEITWNEGKGPEDEEYYTVSFIAQQQFKVFDPLLKDAGTDEEDLPRTVSLQLRKFVETKENPIDSFMPNLQQSIF